MADAAFDTLATARLLRDSGLEERQAVAITEAVRSGVTGGVATKADLTEIKNDLCGSIADQRSDMDARLGPMDTRLGNVEERLGNVEERLGNVEMRLGNVEERLGNVEMRLGNVEERLGNVEERLGNVEAQLVTMDSRILRIENDLLWIKRIGGVIIALLAVPVLRDILAPLF